MEKARILIVDDESAYRETLRLLVPYEGYEVETASTEQEAFDIAQRFSPNVLVIDWLLNDRTDGLEVAEKLRKNHPQMQVVVISGYPAASLEQRARSFSGVQFLTKPFALSALFQAIRTALAQREP